MKTEDIEFTAVGLHKAKLDEAKAQGRIDGERGIPLATNFSLTPYEEKLKKFYGTIKDQINIERSQKLNEFSMDKIRMAEKELKDLDKFDTKKAISNNKERHGFSLENALNSYLIDRKTLLGNRSFEYISNKYDEAKSFMLSKFGRLTTDQAWPKWLNVFLLIIVAGEVYLNYPIFEKYGLSVNATYALTTVISIGFVGLSHFSGEWFKRFNVSTNFKVKFIFSFIALLAMIITLPQIRAAVEEGSETSDIIYFMALGFVLYLIGVGFGYYTSDSHDMFKAEKKKFDAIEKEFDATKKNYEDGITELDNNYSNRVVEINKQLDDRNDKSYNIVRNKKSEISNLTVSNQNVNNEYKEKVNLCTTMFQESVQTYRTTNIQFRNGLEEPKNWKENINNLNLN